MLLLVSSSDSYTVGGLLSASTSSFSIELERREGGRGGGREGGRERGGGRNEVRRVLVTLKVENNVWWGTSTTHSSKRSTRDHTYLVLAREEGLVER